MTTHIWNANGMHTEQQNDANVKREESQIVTTFLFGYVFHVLNVVHVRHYTCFDVEMTTLHIFWTTKRRWLQEF